MPRALAPLLLVLLATAVPGASPALAGATPTRVCRAPDVVGRSEGAARALLRAGHCHARVRHLGDMGRGPVRVVRQSGTRVEVARRSGSCRFSAPYWKTAAHNAFAVVAHTGKDADELWVCIRATGERRWLGHSDDVYPDWEGFDEFALAGPWLVYAEESVARYGSGSQIKLLDVRGRRMRTIGTGGAVLPEIVVNAAGDTAWSGNGGPDYMDMLPSTVQVRPLDGPTRVLFSRPSTLSNIAVITGLSIDATTVRWAVDGVAAAAGIEAGR